MNWIKTSERLPPIKVEDCYTKDSDTVIFWHNGHVFTGYYDYRHNYWIEPDYGSIDHVTHWCEIEPPEED